MKEEEKNNRKKLKEWKREEEKCHHLKTNGDITLNFF